MIDGDYPYFLADDWDPGYRAQRIREVLEERGRAVGRRDGRPAARRPQPDGADAGAAAARAATARTATTATGRRLLADWDFRQPADSAAAAYFNVVWSQTARADLPRRPARGRLARGRRPVDAGGRGAARGARQRVVGRPHHRGGGREPRRRAARRDDGGARRADPPRGPQPRDLGLGSPPPARPGAPDARDVRRRADRAALQPRRLEGRRRRAPSSTRRRGTRPRGTS